MICVPDEEVTIVIDDDGVKMDFDGFKGKSCITKREAIIKKLKSLGVSSKEFNIKNKPELGMAAESERNRVKE